MWVSSHIFFRNKLQPPSICYKFVSVSFVFSFETPTCERHFSPSHATTAAVFSACEIINEQLFILDCPHRPTTLVKIKIKGDHPTLGLLLQPDDHGRLIFNDAAPHAPANRLPRWKSTLRHSTLLEFNNIKIDNKEHLQSI